jgi:nucleoid DNA-binding protein
VTAKARRRYDLDAAVAEKLRMRRAEVSLITEAFLREARRALIEDGEVVFDGFGLLRLVKRRRASPVQLISRHGKDLMPIQSAKYQMCVYFSKSAPLKEALQRHGRYEENPDGKIRRRRGRRHSSFGESGG